MESKEYERKEIINPEQSADIIRKLHEAQCDVQNILHLSETIEVIRNFDGEY